MKVTLSSGDSYKSWRTKEQVGGWHLGLNKPHSDRHSGEPRDCEQQMVRRR